MEKVVDTGNILVVVYIQEGSIKTDNPVLYINDTRTFALEDYLIVI